MVFFRDGDVGPGVMLAMMMSAKHNAPAQVFVEVMMTRAAVAKSIVCDGSVVVDEPKGTYGLQLLAQTMRMRMYAPMT